MAITIIGAPNKFTPAYNPNVFYFSSTNTPLKGFRYLVNLYYAGTTNLIGQFRVAPRPTDAYGVLDVSRIMTNLITHTFSPTNNASIDAASSLVNYDIKIGEEYNTNWTYQDFEMQLTGIYTGKTKLIQLVPTTAHTYVVGDQINVSTLTTGVTATINGLHTIVDVPDAYSIIIELNFPGSGPAIPGTTVYADNRKTQFTDLITSSNYIAFNGALSFKDFRTYSGTEFSINTIPSTTKSFMTNLPIGGNQFNSFYCTPTEKMFINIYNNYYNVTDNEEMSIEYTNSNGDVLTHFIWTTGTSSIIRQVGIGPANIYSPTVISGTTPLIKDDTEWYEFHTFNGTDITRTPTSKTYRVYIDRRCKIEDYEIVFLDRLGSLLSYAFPLRSTETGQITRDSYKQKLGQLTIDEFSYKTYDKGETIYNIDVTKKITLNTDWMNDVMSVLFEELLTSPATYIKIDGQYYACTIDDSSFTNKRQKNKTLIRQTITITLANQNIINV